MRYCAGTVTEHEVHRCIWELTPEEQRHRPYSQRLVYEAGKVVRMDTISGSGTLVKSEDSTLFSYRGEQVVSTTRVNRSGVVKGGSQFSDDEQLVLWRDAQGRPKAKKGSKASGLRRTLDARGRVLSFAYVDSSGQPAPVEEVLEVRVTRNAQGAVVEERYFGSKGEPVLGSSGAHRIVHSVDTHGVDRELRYFDGNGAAMLAHGVHLTRIHSDAFGNELERAFFDLEGRPARSTDWAAAIVRSTRDEHGNETTLEYLDEGGRPIPGESGFATRRRRFNEQDLPVEWSFFGIDGAPVRATGTGSPLMRQTRDARGNVVTERFFDEGARPMLGAEGYHRVEIGYDERDNPNLYRYTDVAGKPVMITRHYHTQKLSYDGDRLVRGSYFDSEGRPVTIDKGYAAYEMLYAADGSEAGTKFIDVNGLVLDTCNGRIGPELQRAIQQRGAETRSCYEQLLQTKPDAAGRLMVELRLATGGQVLRATVVSDELAQPSLTSCVLAKLGEAFALGPEAGSCADVRVPLGFFLGKRGE